MTEHTNEECGNIIKIKFQAIVKTALLQIHVYHKSQIRTLEALILSNNFF